MPGKLWTEEEIAFIKNNYKNLTTHEMAAKLGDRTYRAVMGKMNRLDLVKNIIVSSGELWTEEEIDFIKRNYKDHTLKEMATVLPNRTVRSIESKMRDLGLIKQMKTGLSLKTDYKICPVCKQKKSKKEFYKCSSRYDGIKSMCKKCCYESRVRSKQKKKIEKLKSTVIDSLEKTATEVIKCSKCGKLKLGNEFYFLYSKNKRDTKCIECSKIISKKQVIDRIIEGKEW